MSTSVERQQQTQAGYLLILKSTDRTVERHEMLTQIAEIERPIDASQQVGSRHVIVEIERVKKFVLPAIQLTIMTIPSSPIDIKRIPNDFKKERLFQKNQGTTSVRAVCRPTSTRPKPPFN